MGISKKEQLRARIESIPLGDLIDRKFTTVSPDATVNDILKKMKELDLHEIPVSPDGKRLRGVVSFGWLLKRKNLAITAKADTIAVMPKQIGPGSLVTEAAEAFVSSGFRQIPVVDKEGSIVGIASRTQMLNIIRSIKELRGIPVEELMSTDLIVVHGDDTVDDAVDKMKKLDVRILPVLDRYDHMFGIIGIKDIVDYYWRQKIRQNVGELTGQNSPVQLKVESLAVEGPFTISPSATLDEAAAKMMDKNISSLPVMEDGKLRGIITKYDMVELIASFRHRDRIYVQVSGLEQDQRFALEQMDKQMTASLQKIAKYANPMLLNVHVTKYNAQGNNFKYSLHGRLIVDGRLINGTAVDWDLIKASDSLMQNFERRTIDMKEEQMQHRRRTRNIGHA